MPRVRASISAIAESIVRNHRTRRALATNAVDLVDERRLAAREIVEFYPALARSLRVTFFHRLGHIAQRAGGSSRQLLVARRAGSQIGRRQSQGVDALGQVVVALGEG